MPDVPLICPLCSEALTPSQIRSHNKENHGGEGLVPPPPRKDQAALRSMRDT